MDWHTNKAVFFTDQEYVYKKYFKVGSAVRDAALLRLIEEVYTTFELGGWKYRALRIFPVENDNNELIMERLQGETLKDAFERTKDPDLFLHAGRWLGLLHKDSEDLNGRVLAFNDYNCSNVMLD